MHQGNNTPPIGNVMTDGNGLDDLNALEERMRVLIVEDDAALGLFLQKGLKLEGHEVTWVGDGEAALIHAEEHRPDLIVLDLSLPRKDGTEVLAELSGRFDETAVLVLTGRSQVEERVKCLNLGADDCLLKPFSFHELTARCRALLRRREQYADPVLRHGDVELNRMERRVTRNGQVVDLTVKEFALLEFLLMRRGRCCNRAELLREVWQMSPDAGTNVVDVYINYLRKKLGVASIDEDSGHCVIETVRGEGYQMGGAKKMVARANEYRTSAAFAGA
jgi:DNA-binding response OmpR family regulator